MTHRIIAVVAVLAVTGPATAQITFVNRAHDLGAGNLSTGRASAMVDLDNDGRLDLITANAGMSNSLFRQREDGTFQDMNKIWGVLPDDRQTWGVLATDFDDDGDVDVFFVNGSYYTPEANQLLRNDLATRGTFTDVSHLSDAGAASQDFGATAFDYDHDNDIDIFVSVSGPGTTKSCFMLRNDSDMIFTRVPAGMSELGHHVHCSSGDFDNDGWIDVAVGRPSGNRLYRNNGDGTFTDVAVEAGVLSPWGNFGMVLEDFDNDGWLDIYLPKYQPLGGVFATSEIYRNNGDGTFTDVTQGSQLTGQTDMGHSTHDVDADGYPDIYIGTGHPSFKDYDVLFLMHPDGRGGLVGTDVSLASGISSEGKTRCHGMAFGDFDRDGNVDVYVNNGGPFIPETLQNNFLWQSQGNPHHWIQLHLRGVVSNRAAVGAHAVAHTSAGRAVHRRLRVGHGFANTDSPILHFGIGLDDHVERIDINWPSGITQSIYQPPMSTVVEVVEPVATWHDKRSLGAP